MAYKLTDKMNWAYSHSCPPLRLLAVKTWLFGLMGEQVKLSKCNPRSPLWSLGLQIQLESAEGPTSPGTSNFLPLETGWSKQAAQSYPTLCDSVDCSSPGSSVLGISQARILEWVAMPSSRGSSKPRDWTHISCIGRWILYHWTTCACGKPLR